MDDIISAAQDALARLLAQGAPPPAIYLAAAIIAGAVLSVVGPLRRIADQLGTVAHEGGHALAALVTGRKVQRVHVNPDGSGTTWTHGRQRGIGSFLVSFAGYPFPAIAGAALIAASTADSVRLWAAVAALLLLALLLRMRNVHGVLVVALAVAGTAAAAWYLPANVLALGMAALGAALLTGAVASLLQERKGRRRGVRGSDVSALADRGRLPAPAYWLAMMTVVLASAWAAWQQIAPSLL